MPVTGVSKMIENTKLAQIGELVNKGLVEVMPFTACKGKYQSNHCKSVNFPGGAGCVLKYYCKNQADLMREG
jgi:hypothetical protein